MHCGKFVGGGGGLLPRPEGPKKTFRNPTFGWMMANALRVNLCQNNHAKETKCPPTKKNSDSDLELGKGGLTGEGGWRSSILRTLAKRPV